ncbi:hypothetical protein ABZP36_022010 [Zizania latifolia]
MANSYPLLLLLLFFSNSMAKLVDGDELQTLLTIKRDWGSPAALSSWKARNFVSSTHCNWAGVTCTSTGQVTALSFPSFKIAKPIPASICSLKNLTLIDLSYNNLTGNFPMVLYNCLALQYLDLSNNQFSSSLPDDISKLSSEMLHLNLSSNAFIGNVPSAIAAFPKLKSLLLDTNSFNGSYPGAAIGGLMELETLTLAINPFMPGPVPEEFGKLTKLKTLWLSGMNLTGAIPDALSPLTELTLLDMSWNKMEGRIPEWVWKLQKLEYLYLYANKFSGEISPDITALNLLELDLSSNELTGPIPEAVGNMKNLTWLFLYFNNLTRHIPMSVATLPSLTDIRLFDNMLSGPLPPELGKHSKLANLEVCNNNFSGELPDTLCLNKKLYDIVVFNNSFSGVFPANLGDCDTLDNIMAYNNHFVGDFPEKIWSFPKLINIMIQDNSFTGALPSEIAHNISRIEMGNNRFSGVVPSSAVGLKNFKAENNLFSGTLPADMSALANVTELNLAGNHITLVSVAITGWLLLHRRKNDLGDVTSWKMTQFRTLDFTKHDIISNINEGNMIGRGGSGKVYPKWASRRYKNGGPIADLVDDEIQDPDYLDDMVAMFELGVVCTGEDPTSRPPMSEVLHRLLQCHHRCAYNHDEDITKPAFGIDNSLDCIV